jgi:hypothetical protein
MHGLSTYLRRHHIGLLALFIALGGTSYAAVSLSANSVGARELKNRAVGSSELKDRSIMKRDLRERLLASLRRGGSGTPGPAGPQAPPGPAEGPAGGVLTGTYPNPGLADGVVGTSKLAQLPAARLRVTSEDQMIPSGPPTPIRFLDAGSVQYDIGGMFNPAGPPLEGGVSPAAALTFPVTGTYVVTGAVRWAANPTGNRNLFLNGSQPGGVRASSSVAAMVGDTTRQVVATTERFRAGEHVFISASQNSGAPLALDASQNQIHLSAAFIGP